MDPMGAVDGSNLYQFVRSNPVGLVDPLGLAEVPTGPQPPGTYPLGAARPPLPPSWYLGPKPPMWYVNWRIARWNECEKFFTILNSPSLGPRGPGGYSGPTRIGPHHIEPIRLSPPSEPAPGFGPKPPGGYSRSPAGASAGSRPIWGGIALNAGLIILTSPSTAEAAVMPSHFESARNSTIDPRDSDGDGIPDVLDPHPNAPTTIDPRVVGMLASGYTTRVQSLPLHDVYDYEPTLLSILGLVDPEPVKRPCKEPDWWKVAEIQEHYRQLLQFTESIADLGGSASPRVANRK
jgi:hypothetical protein